MSDAIHPVQARPRDIFGVPQSRKTFNCLVVGSSGSGKSSFLDSFILAKNPAEEGKDAALPMSGGAGFIGALNETRSVVKVIKEKDAKNKEQYNNKYLTLTEIPEEMITSDSLFDESNEDILNKCDAVIYIFESNDSEQVDFVKKATEKFKENDVLQFVPSILLQSKMDL